MINSVDPERETNLRPATPKGPDGGGSQYNEITRKRKQNAHIKQSKTQKENKTNWCDLFKRSFHLQQECKI